jgi:two-component system sensor histidine kinase UhpB
VAPGVLSLHVVSDALITLAYFSIPFTLLHFVSKRRDLEFHWMFVCFAVFIVACGTTHPMEIWVIWNPTYWLSSTVKAITAVASVPTAILLVRLIPEALQLPSPSTLKRANAELARQMVERERAEADARRLNEQLERRVAERTQQLETANRQLLEEARERHRAEQDLRESERRMRAVVDSALSGVIVMSAEGRIIDWNSCAETLFGWTRAEVVGRVLSETIIPLRYREAHTRGLSRFLATGEGPVFNRLVELSALRRDGEEFPVELSISPLRSGDVVREAARLLHRRLRPLAPVRVARRIAPRRTAPSSRSRSSATA